MQYNGRGRERKKIKTKKSEVNRYSQIWFMLLIWYTNFAFLLFLERKKVYASMTIEKQKSKYLTVEHITHLGIWCGSDTYPLVNIVQFHFRQLLKKKMKKKTERENENY